MTDCQALDLETYTTVAASTAHITQHDGELLTRILEDHEGVNQLIVYDRRYGWLIYCYADDIDDQSPTDAALRAQGFSQAFVDLLRLAGRRGARYLDLDRDVPAIDGLPTFDWT